MKEQCPLCGGKHTFNEVLRVENVFASSDIFEFEARKRRGDIGYGRGDCTMDLWQCSSCGFIYNFAFSMPKMIQAYTNEAYYQQKVFTQRTNKIFETIKDKIKSNAKENDVFLEIAPGHCDLLRVLAKESKIVYSVDPSPTTMKGLPKNVKHIQSFFDSKKIKENVEHKIDFIIFRHLLEHIEEPRKFLEEVMSFLEVGGKIYVEVPNSLEVFGNKTFCEFYHDHCGYFTKNTLVNIFASMQCKLIDEHYPYNGQWMGFVFEKIEPTAQRDLPLPPVFFQNTQGFKNEVEKLNSILKKYQSISLWGGGDSL